MKKIYLLIIMLGCFQLTKAVNEIPNSSFENWATGNPVGWMTDNVPGYYIPITQTSPGHTGSYAIKGQPVIFLNDTLPPTLSSPSSSYGFNITQNYSNLEFYYKSNLIGGDKLTVSVVIEDGSHSSFGIGSAEISTNTSGFTFASVPIYYINGNAAATAVVTFSISGGASNNRPNPSSYFIIDDVTLTGLAAVEEITAGNKLQVFPVPAHDLLSIKGQTDNSKPIHFILTDATGRVAVEKKSESSPGNFLNIELDLHGIVPGFYSLLMITEDKELFRRIVVQ